MFSGCYKLHVLCFKEHAVSKLQSTCFLSHLLIEGCNIWVQISVRPSVYMYVEVWHLRRSFCFLCISDSCDCETLHSNCPWHTLQACKLNQCPWPIFHGPLTLLIFTSKLCRSLVFSASVIAMSVKPCMVIVLDIPFKHAPWPSALDLYFMVHWLC